MPHNTAFVVAATAVLLAAAPALWAEPELDVKYDSKHERNVLDFWPAKESKAAAPVFVWFHGGGFRQGDKRSLARRGGKMMKAYQEAGYAVVSCNYPFLNKEEGMDYPDIVKHCARAVQFVRSKAEEWKIDPQRLCCGGASAGALISEFLGYHDDFADPKATDEVAKESSKPAVVISHMQPIGTQEFAIRYMDKGEAPLFIYTNSPESDRIHHPKQAVLIRDKAGDLGIPCVALSEGRNELPAVKDGETWLGLQLQFCEEHLPKKDK